MLHIQICAWFSSTIQHYFRFYDFVYNSVHHWYQFRIMNRLTCMSFYNSHTKCSMNFFNQVLLSFWLVSVPLWILFTHCFLMMNRLSSLIMVSWMVLNFKPGLDLVLVRVAVMILCDVSCGLWWIIGEGWNLWWKRSSFGIDKIPSFLWFVFMARFGFLP